MPAEPVSARVGEIDAYLVESRSVGGLSGSPVFVDVDLLRNVGNVREYRRSVQPTLYRLGVMNAHRNAPAESVMIEGDLSTEMVNMGIAVVTPIDKVFNVIDQSTYGRAIQAVTDKLMETPLSAANVDGQGRLQVEVQIELDEDDR
jgi:hypothetical protein